MPENSTNFDDETLRRGVWKKKPGPLPPPADFKKFTLPLIRRIYPQLIADKLVGVQPLTSPLEEVSPIPTKPRKYRSIDDPWEEVNG